MTTAAMWLRAQYDGFTYQSGDLFYDRRDGFHDQAHIAWKGSAFDTLDKFMSINDWIVYSGGHMTKCQAEELLGMTIDDD